ncbi:sigma-70 family RNA polymerase sigma factor [Pseudomonas sp. NC26]|uniref:Sigma-70 family RNA polymerase sigma factor n=1 Tax=Pseudomonas putida TaxID=303 RepID=A0A7W2KZR1_PSEPU|nr:MULTISPECIES: sigma-70 family RNA polymerase sigma factor [Pseudomonas]MBA6115566.1 sigma-70 family RNA polymerase sigma factor [Pseudomonas putida]MCZ9635974.1 sigma-70 family RNA polymerase sigma factor [Pseudomonas putida]MEC4876523.1 sigma-70 family RNA polymerase sigma factor [Pseudomonas sp. NC26]
MRTILTTSCAAGRRSITVPSALSSTVEGLYHAHHAWLTSWLRRRLGCPQSAADLAQDTYVRMLQAREAPQLVEPRAFLATVAKRVLCNHFRRQELERAYLEALAQVPENVAPSEEQKAIIFETLLALDRLLDDLPPLIKRTFLLAQVDGLGQAEIARELGISLATVKRYLNKAALRCYFAL